jgi:hypothetical protein
LVLSARTGQGKCSANNAVQFFSCHSKSSPPAQRARRRLGGGAGAGARGGRGEKPKAARKERKRDAGAGGTGAAGCAGTAGAARAASDRGSTFEGASSSSTAGACVCGCVYNSLAQHRESAREGAGSVARTRAGGALPKAPGAPPLEPPPPPRATPAPPAPPPPSAARQQTAHGVSPGAPGALSTHESAHRSRRLLRLGWRLLHLHRRVRPARQRVQRGPLLRRDIAARSQLGEPGLLVLSQSKEVAGGSGQGAPLDHRERHVVSVTPSASVDNISRVERHICTTRLISWSSAPSPASP